MTMAIPAPRSATLTITGPLRRADLAGLYARTCALLEARPIDVLCCELVDVAAEAVAVDALARLALAASRHGCCVRLDGASPELGALIDLMGLADVLLRASELGVEVRREPEQREDRRGAEEERQLDDAPVGDLEHL
jgi:ABC-type transporter Mla MlaB component